MDIDLREIKNVNLDNQVFYTVFYYKINATVAKSKLQHDLLVQSYFEPPPHPPPNSNDKMDIRITNNKA